MESANTESNAASISIEGRDHKRQELTNVIAHHSPRLHRIALARLGNVADAEDAVQDAFLSALRHIDQFRGDAQMSTWVTAIVINSARMRLRQRLAPVQLALDQVTGEEIPLADLISDTRPDPEAAYRSREISAVLARATSRLSSGLRTTFQLRDLDGLTIRETAHVMGVSTGTVKARLSRARTRLREAAGKHLRRRRLRTPQ